MAKRSSKKNVHPDHYKLAGRERQGEDIVPEVEKARLTQQPAWPNKPQRAGSKR